MGRTIHLTCCSLHNSVNVHILCHIFMFYFFYAFYLFFNGEAVEHCFLYSFHQLSFVRHRACATQFMALQKGTVTCSFLPLY